MDWVTDDECCWNCGCLLLIFETTLCSDCLEDERYNEDQELYESFGWEYEDEQ